MFGKILCLLVLGSAAFGSALQFIDCGSKVGRFTGITVSNCDTSQNACILKRKTNATIEIEFSLDEDATQVHTVVHGVVLGVPIPFPLPNADACANSDSGISCPLAKGGSYHYKATLPVEKTYPKVSVEVKWELQDQNGADIVCVMIPAKISN